MILRLALSRLLPIILRLWGIDRAVPRAGPDSILEEFATVAINRSRMRSRLRVAIAPRARPPRK